ncbi:MAG: hypothetical protein EAZ97_15370 [Bacteroidetes bacterium]|nr:MAG: hypothetical protein EAZ97_15370 [Bacteroidota bacterium]
MAKCFCWKFMSKILTVFICFFLSFYTYSQDLKFWHLTIKDGLSNNSVNCLLQDTKGFMWIGTADGLNRYDGYKFELYQNDTQDEYTVSNNFIQTLYEDQNQNIWIGTEGGGLCKYDRKNNRMIRISEIKKAIVYEMLENQNKLWVIADNGLFYSDHKSDKFTKYPYPAFTKSVLKTMISLSANKFLVGTFGSGFYILDINTGKTQQFLHEKNKNSLSNNYVTSFYKDIKGYIWIGTENGLNRFDSEKQTFEHFEIGKDPKKSLLVNYVKQIIGQDNQIFFATENGGLSVLDLKTMLFTHHIPNTNNPESISDISIRTVYKDRQNRLWVGAFSSGVNIVDPKREKFSKFDIVLKNKIVNAIFEDSKKRLWIGTEGGLILKDGEKIVYNFDNSFSKKPILSIYEDDKNRIWVGTWEGSLGFFDEKKKQFVNFKADPKNPNKLSNPNIFGIIQSSQTKEILAISLGGQGGLHILKNEAEQNFMNYTNKDQDTTSIGGQLCKKIYEDSKKNIWIGTFGLNRFDMNTQKFVRYIHSKNNDKSLNNNFVNTIYEDSKQRLWIGTVGGLSMMLDDAKFVNYTKLNGLPSNTINGILEDSKGNLWISTGEGISKFNMESKIFRNYDQSDGLQSKQFKTNSCFKAQDGTLYFGGVNGLNAFYPDSIKDNLNKPSVVITGLKLFNKHVFIGEYDSLLKTDISQTQEIIFDYKQSVFTLDFVALNFTQSNKNQYAYKLEGFEKEWNFVGTQRSATYTSLPAGTYTFRVKASNNDGIWNEKGTSLIIQITPPFWETWWFRLSMISILLGAGLAFYKIRMNEVRKTNRKLEKKVQEKTRQIQQAYEEIQVTNEELQQSQEEIISQRDLLESRNNLLEESTHKISKSIEAAKLIQKAILPSKDRMNELFSEYFIFLKPKDVVSGDFLWTDEIEDKKYLIVADCTGHGVSGAMLTMIGSALLDRIIRLMSIYNPAEILEKLHFEINKLLRQDQNKRDEGMDIAVLCWHEAHENCHLTFAAAKRPLYYFYEGKIEKILGTRRNIGGFLHVKKGFENQNLILPKGNVVYLCSDGYADQNSLTGEKITEKTLLTILEQSKDLSLKDQKEILRQQLKDHTKGVEQRDDILVVGVRI